MSNFPLFDNLNKDLPNEEITVKQKDKFIKQCRHKSKLCITYFKK